MATKRKAAAAHLPPPPKSPQVEESVEEDEEEESEDEEEESEEQNSESSYDESNEEEEEEESSSKGSGGGNLRKLLRGLRKNELIDFLEEEAVKDPSLVDRINEAVGYCDPAHRNIFLHGLDWTLTQDQVLSVFKKYGQVENCKVVTDKFTGRNKGYGFVLFKTRHGALKALQKTHKKIGNRVAYCQLATAGHTVGTNPFPDWTNRKIYVSNVGPHVEPDKLRAFFAQFGDIDEGPLGHDHATGKLKGFAIFVYKTVEGCNKAVQEPVKMFDGCKLQCRQFFEGRRTTKNQRPPPPPPAATSRVQQTSHHINNTDRMNYGRGITTGHGVNPAGVAVGQNPVMGMAMGGLPPSNPIPSLGLNGNNVINSVSRSVIGSYGPQAALQGLGAYQSAQPGHSSATRSQSAFTPAGITFPHPYFCR
ncbi:hypothetical protein Acr_12g0006510 [Actinidia rufa]|uniref:RRM domain-containing protein n=1 Tax=Actinidia rufa TaxID=165716 RepID=A0A7J0FHE1_9ERIC|nr:hypothetical protein Acr_12g0006510 [Actinidia rufa]